MPIHNVPGATLVTHDKEGGRSYWVPSQDNYFLDILSRGPYQYQSVKRFKDLCSNPRHIIDIGVNLAQNVPEYAQMAPKVTGFEPTPSNYVCALATIDENRHLYPDTDIVVHQVGLADVDGEMELATHSSNVGTNYLIRNGKKHKNTVKVDIKTLDSYNLTEVDIIKIDVEGYELYVLQGGEKTIMRDRPFIQTEIRNNQCERAGYHPQALQDWFNARDYVRTLKNGQIIEGTEYQKLDKGDSFWIPREKLVVPKKEEVNELFEFE